MFSGNGSGRQFCIAEVQCTRAAMRYDMDGINAIGIAKMGRNLFDTVTFAIKQNDFMGRVDEFLARYLGGRMEPRVEIPGSSAEVR